MVYPGLTYWLSPLLLTGIKAYWMQDPQLRPHLIASLYLAEAGSAGYLRALSHRARREGDSWLANQLIHHSQDEKHHSTLLLKALHYWDKDPIQLTKLPATDPRRRTTFYDSYYHGYATSHLHPQSIGWLTFLSSTYVLEADSVGEFRRLASALPASDVGCRILSRSLHAIANDERRHAQYLLEALSQRQDPPTVAFELEHWRQRKLMATVALVEDFWQDPHVPQLAQAR